MTEVEVTAVGNATGIVLPKEMLAKLQVMEGDKLYAVETPAGIELTAHNPEFGKQMDLAESIMRQDRDVLKKLAG